MVLSYIVFKEFNVFNDYMNLKVDYFLGDFWDEIVVMVNFFIIILKDFVVEGLVKECLDFWFI